MGKHEHPDRAKTAIDYAPKHAAGQRRGESEADRVERLTKLIIKARGNMDRKSTE